MTDPKYGRNLVREGLALQALEAAIHGHDHPETHALTTLRDAGWTIRKYDDGVTVTITLKRPGK